MWLEISRRILSAIQAVQTYLESRTFRLPVPKSTERQRGPPHARKPAVANQAGLQTRRPHAQPVPSALVHGLRHTYATELAGSDIRLNAEIARARIHDHLTAVRTAAGVEIRNAAHLVRWQAHRPGVLHGGHGAQEAPRIRRDHRPGDGPGGRVGGLPPASFRLPIPGGGQHRNRWAATEFVAAQGDQPGGLGLAAGDGAAEPHGTRAVC